MTAKRQPRTAEGTVPMQVKVPPSVLAAAKARAAERGETLSAAVVAFLRRYSR